MIDRLVSLLKRKPKRKPAPMQKRIERVILSDEAAKMILKREALTDEN